MGQYQPSPGLWKASAARPPFGGMRDERPAAMLPTVVVFAAALGLISVDGRGDKFGILVDRKLYLSPGRMQISGNIGLLVLV
ncbi:hypothetical protein GEV33_008567 [Tenebrio molitor]|uniref:Uncharacterized protein n=1 Tax=Tenebrio molitor TaxID=7067 RepID=A0A8J6L9Z7_TENMO|nr:hypothetical protein GEV33_008567 [Tenebrio molitor]